MNAEKDMDGLRAKGGVEGLAGLLHSSTHDGLTEEGVAASSHTFGPNRYKEVPPKNFFKLAYETAQDPIIILLIVAAAVSTTLGAAIPEEREKNGWVEGVAIWIAVIIVICVGAGNDWQKDRQFRKLNAQREAIQVKVVRGGAQVLVNNTDVVVGDVLLLDTGDKVIADGVVVESFNLTLDEASLTGEGDPIHKNIDQDPWVRSGTQVTEGSGKVVVVAVGPHSEWGKILAMVTEEEDQQTPLQEKLEIVATAIGKVGLFVAVACFIAMLIKWCVENKGFPIKKINDHGPVQFFLYAITIIVVAVPEGLPLAVTISLAYSMKKMMKDNNFVRVLSACETMGGATAVCSDKTGTLTENRMTVTKGWFCGAHSDEVPAPEALPREAVVALGVNVAMTSKAFLIENEDGTTGFVGNRTECALLIMCRKWGIDYKAERERLHADLFQLYGFSSERKMSCCVMREGGKLVVYNKGAAEWVLKRCTSQMTAQGRVVPLSEAEKAALIENEVVAMASTGLRCIALTTASLPASDATDKPADWWEDASNVDQNLTLLAIVGIKDPVRQEVPDAVATCQGAGITVRMVTGDNIHTARHIARECGILPPGSDFLCMEGPEFRKMGEEEMAQTLPRLRVLARSSPEDKRILVKSLRALNEVVAVTGDGTNDAPALKESDVGLAMGIAGTEVAKEAADIVILDDNFSSIVKSVLWGRSVFTNIRKFLQFQLTVNFVALVTAFVGAVVGGVEPLTVLQLLWVNMIMDSMGALALATENPTPDLLKMRPHGREESLITPRMWKHILTQGIYQLFWMFVFLYALPEVIPSRYALRSSTEIYREECVGHTDNVFNATQTADYCNFMGYCGFPKGDAQSSECLLKGFWQSQGNASVPGIQGQAVCSYYAGTVLPANATCADNGNLITAQKRMDDKLQDWKDEDRYKSTSVLFNAFIMMQLANEINARRINDEYDFFSGVLSSPIFLGVIVVTMGLQAIIINFLGAFFKTVVLDWKEWLATIAIGMGAWPVSLLVRWVSRTMRCHEPRNKTADDHGGQHHGEAHYPPNQVVAEPASASAANAETSRA